MRRIGLLLLLLLAPALADGSGTLYVKADWRVGYITPTFGYSFLSCPSVGDCASLELVVEGRFDSLRTYLDFYGEDPNHVWRTDSLDILGTDAATATYAFRRLYNVPVLATVGSTNTAHLDDCMFLNCKFRVKVLSVTDSIMSLPDSSTVYSPACDSVRALLIGRER